MNTRPEQMSRAELLSYLRSLEARLREDAERRALVHDLQVHQEELEAQKTQLVEAQQALEVARDLYADLFEFAPLGYVLLDVQGIIEEINGTALRLLRVSDRLRVARYPFWMFVAKDDRQTFRAHLRVLRAGAEHSRTEVRFGRRGTNEGPMVQVYSRVWTNRQSGETRFLTALIDVTERWRAQEDHRAAEMARRALVEEERAMRAANEAKDRFLAALSHELRTPLTPILLALDRLATRDDIPGPIEPTLRMVRRNVEQEARLIDDLLDVTRIAHDKLRCEHEIVEIHTVLRELHAVFVQEAAGAGIGLTLELAATEPYVLGDAVRLKQIVSNLLRNAIRHTGAGGAISIRSATPAPGRIRIAVSDSGAGIPVALLKRIFIPFEQGDRAAGAGLGLGLAIAKGLVEQHAGTIAAHSEGPGTGTTLTVELPTVEAPAESHDGAKSSIGHAARHSMVLLVEDHADSAEALELGLSGAGYRVVVADSVRAALAHADEEFDVVVSDLGLPDGSGLDVMSGLLARRPVVGIALSGFGAESDVRSTREAGFQRHLVKPVDLSHLIETIETLLAAEGPAGRTDGSM
jgi:PAS domain S-box-containing protein